jgi:hypothetical protein
VLFCFFSFFLYATSCLFLLLFRLELSKGILCPRPRVCDPVLLLIVAIGIASPRLLPSVPRSLTPVTSRLAIGYLEPLSSRLAPPLQLRSRRAFRSRPIARKLQLPLPLVAGLLHHASGICPRNDVFGPHGSHSRHTARP